jgi:hypothetical protein
VRRFSERTSDQIATIFGLDEASQVGHYYISSPGEVTVDGWVFGITGQLFENVNGTVDYAATRAEWTGGRESWDLGLTARSLGRSGIERDHDLTTSVEATVPASATRVSVAWRVNTGFSRPAADEPGLGGRFAIEVRQQLPVRPLGRGELNLLVSARTLLHEIGRAGAYYDELLTLAPPLRLSCGLQMRF